MEKDWELTEGIWGPHYKQVHIYFVRKSQGEKNCTSFLTEKMSAFTNP